MLSNKFNQVIYLDNNATTQIDGRVLEEMMPFLTNEFAAFSSIRFSVGKFNTKKEMDIVIDAVKNVVSDLRAMVS
jgi:cysteine sulfinate desulfinase/cysteine desulfurase-like protein